MRSIACSVALVLLAFAPGVAHAAAPERWRAADAVAGGLFDARTELVLGERARANAAVGKAARAYDGALRASVKGADTAADRAVRSALADAWAAARAGDRVALAAAAGALRSALLQGTYAAALKATVEGDADAARGWLKVREFRTATRFTRPGADGTLAVERLAARTLAPAAARRVVERDLLDAYGARLSEHLAEAARGEQDALPERRAEAAARAQGSFAIVAARFAQDRGTAARRALEADLAALVARARRGGPQFSGALTRAIRALEGFAAAPLSPDEAVRRSGQLLRFLELVSVEYGRGVDARHVNLEFEIQEAVAFRNGAVAAFADLRPALGRRDLAATQSVAAGLDRLGQLVETATRQKDDVVHEDDVEALTKATVGRLRAVMPNAWQTSTDDSDYDLINVTLDRVEAAMGAAHWKQAEQARLEAYAFFEFGPERRLKSFDPGLALEVEGLIWFGASGKEGLAELISRHAPRREARETRLVLDRRLADAAATLGDSASKTTVVTNAAIIVFREGLEGVLILAAITASFVGVRRRLRRPVMVGAFLGLVASVVTWVLAQTLLRSLEHHGERLEAIVGIVAIAVLLLITNWFFHRVYWSEWIGRFHRQRKKIERFRFFGAQAVGLAILGLTSVYREGFETVLFLQSLQLEAGTATVVEGAGLGLAATFAVALVTFKLQRKLPYKKMLVVTGVFIGFVLIVMVGQTVRTMQGAGWMSISPVDVEVPNWAGMWLGVFPTWETIGGQIVAAIVVIGSYFAAREMKVKRPVRRATARPVQDETAVDQGTLVASGEPLG